MVTDEGQEDSQDSDVQTQTQTQSTQQASQVPNPEVDSHLWGYLQPCNTALTRIDFWKINPRYTIGRNRDSNQVVLPGFKVSNLHCTITWDGIEDNTSAVVVHDNSSNGTFINGEKIGKGLTRILNEGNELAFGTCVPQPHNQGLEDYRFIYRHCAAGLPTEGLYAFYDVGTELGKGSFATVRKAMSRATGEWFAVKMIHGSRTVRNGNTGEGTSSRNVSFAREISIMETLKHPNICALKEVFFEKNNDINLVLELISGGDLLDYIIKNNGISELDAKHITYQICDALAYIHARGIAHRDLKPENVLLTTDNPPMVKVADFGLAKVVDSLTMLRTMCGTPAYLAPEVVKQENQEGYDNVVDSWSVGVIVFSMLTNSSPFVEDMNQRDVRARIAERWIDWSYLDQSGVSVEAQNFLRSLLEQDPLRRMTLADALHHPWLQTYTPVYSSGPVSPSPSAGASGIKREGSRTAPLQRRSHVVTQAAEGNGDLPIPSEDMIERAQSQAGPSNWSAMAKGQNKRLHPELSPLPEEGPGVSEDDDPSSAPRRSTRQPQKAPRRF
ncbi:kinase-like domain-containing protein [Infundibulicybe gibba]|nr:kinase-like domain-containing protein [Infundibulicybe gibba]